ncbi:MAG TPA: exodeoxyribonuclease VII large subunit [Sphingobacteriaceae bacterium]
MGARVGVNFHPVYGLSLVLYELDAQLTLGGIELQRKETLDRILREYPGMIRFVDGKFQTPNKEVLLPQVIQRIALVTSYASDAYNDFMHCLAANEFGYQFRVDDYHVLVQGYGAQASLTSALVRIRDMGGYDAVVITRGGGAPADFLPFDDYSLALQVATFPVPVITGIGHHTNQGISDFFASVHTKTPTMAAQFILDRNLAFERRMLELSGAVRERSTQMLRDDQVQLDELRRDLKGSVQAVMSGSAERIQFLQRSVSTNVSALVSRHTRLLQIRQVSLTHQARILLSRFASLLAGKSASLTYLPRQRIQMEKQKTAGLTEQILERAPKLITSRKKELDYYKENIRNLSPGRIMERGFAMVRKNGQILSGPEQVLPGDDLEIIHGDSLIRTAVKNKSKYDGREFNI